MKKKLIIINGVMGVGKTTVSKKLYKSLENSFYLDGDRVWDMNPFRVTEENKKMVVDNICYMLNSFINNSSSKYIVFCWVIPTDKIMDSIVSRLNLKETKVYKITLMASKEELIRRISKDIAAGLRDVENLRRSMSRYELYKKMNTLKIDTTNKNAGEVVEIIKDSLS